MKNIVTKISILVTFILVLTSSRCQTYVNPGEYYLGVQNSSNTELSTLRIEYQQKGSNVTKATEWALTQRQYNEGDVYRFAARDTMDGYVKFHMQLIDKSGIAVADTTLLLGLGTEHMVTYMFKYKEDKTLELETIIKPL